MTKTIQTPYDAEGSWLYLDDNMIDALNDFLNQKGKNLLTEKQITQVASIKIQAESSFSKLSDKNISKIKEDLLGFNNQINKMITNIDKLYPNFIDACYTTIHLNELKEILLKIQQFNEENDQFEIDLCESNEIDILCFAIKRIQNLLDIKLTAYKGNNVIKGSAIDIMMILLPDITKHYKPKILSIIKELKQDNK